MTTFNPLDVPCDYCGAYKNHRCLTGLGKRRGGRRITRGAGWPASEPHQVRISRAASEARQATAERAATA